MATIVWRDYAAAKFARHYKKAIGAAGAIGAIVLTILLCHQAGRWVGDAECLAPDFIIEGPLGTYKVYGAKDWLEPVIEQGRRMNKIEAKENHSLDPTLSPDPEDY